MKNLELNAYGVSEMNVAEMQQTEGGFWVAVAWCVAGILISECLDKNASQDFEDGRQSARDFWGKNN